MLEILESMPPFINSNFDVVDMEVYVEAKKAHKAMLHFYVTRDSDGKGKYIWRAGYAYSGLPELSQIAIRDESLEVALKKLKEKLATIASS